MARMIARKPPPQEYPEFSRVITATGRRDPLTGIITHTMEIEEIERITEAFGQAAIRGKEANFDAVWIHGGHGYLIHQFLSPRTNHRTDQYGGSRENRARFTVGLIKEGAQSRGTRFPHLHQNERR